MGEFSLADPNIRYVTFGCLLLVSSASVVGCFTFLRKKALLGDAIAHSILPGVCLGFLLAQEKNPVYLLAGAFVTGWISVWLMGLITSRTKLKEDTAIGLVLSVFFGIGILLLTAIQQQGNASQSGLDHFLFGKAASLVESDVITFGMVSVALLLTILFFYKELKLLCFDKNFAQSVGLPIQLLEWILTSITVLAVVTGIQAVGVVLMAAILITPAAAARYWTDRLGIMIGLSAFFGGISAFSGTYISYLSPAMPTGPWMVMVVSVIAVCSFTFAPHKGIVSRWLQQRRNQQTITDDNILKSLFQLGEKRPTFYDPYPLEQIQSHRMTPINTLKKGLKRLQREGYVRHQSQSWILTHEGKNRGQRITRLHRLWELYLTEYLRIAPDHVHDDAEMIEHIITPEIEARLQEQLQYPTQDPHQKQIPN